MSGARIKGTLQYLTSESREERSAGNTKMTGWIKNTLAQYGVPARLQPIPDKEVSNVIGSVKGADATAVFGAGAHLDSKSKEGGEAPGADDNGTGVVAMLEAARVLGAYPKTCFKTSLDFVAFNDEEKDMEGSPAYLATLRNRRMKGFINMDMLGHGDSPALRIRYEDSQSDEFLASATSSAVKAYSIPLQVTVEESEEDVMHNSDQGAFWDAGLPANYWEETDQEGPAHSPDDTIEQVNLSEVTMMTKALVATLAELVSGTGGAGS